MGGPLPALRQWTDASPTRVVASSAIAVVGTGPRAQVQPDGRVDIEGQSATPPEGATTSGGKTHRTTHVRAASRSRRTTPPLRGLRPYRVAKAAGRRPGDNALRLVAAGGRHRRPRSVTPRRESGSPRRHACCTAPVRAPPLRPRYDATARRRSWPRPFGYPGGPLGPTRPSLPDARIPLPGSPPRSGSTGRAVLGRSPGPAAAVGLLVPDRAAAVPRGGAVGLGAGAAPSSRRPADRERQNPAGPRSDGTRRIERVVPRSDTNPARAVAASHQAHVCRSRRLLWRRRPRARRADRRHLRERLPAHGPARQPLRPPRGRRGAPLPPWPARRGPRDVDCIRPAGTHGDPSARCRGRGAAGRARWPDPRPA